MSLIDLRRRLERLEATRRVTAPTRILTDRPIGDEGSEAAAVYGLANWRALIAQGRASVMGDVLCLTSPEMTAEEWAAAHVTEH